MKVTVTVSGQQPDGSSFLRIVPMDLEENPIVMRDGTQDILRRLKPFGGGDLVTLVGDVRRGPDEIIYVPDDGNGLRETYSGVVSIMTEDGRELIQHPLGWRK